MIFWPGIFWLEISAWNFGLKVWPEKIKPEILALKNRPEFQARNFDLNSYFGSQMNRPLQSCLHYVIYVMLSVYVLSGCPTCVPLCSGN